MAAKRLSVSLSEVIAAKLTGLSLRTGLGEAEIIRAALVSYILKQEAENGQH